MTERKPNCDQYHRKFRCGDEKDRSGIGYHTKVTVKVRTSVPQNNLAQMGTPVKLGTQFLKIGETKGGTEGQQAEIWLAQIFELTALKYAKLVVDLKLTIGNDCTCSIGRRRPTKYGKSVETPIFCTFCVRKDTK